MRFWKPRSVQGLPTVGMAIASHLATLQQERGLECLVSSLAAQTYGNWKALVVHDGPVSPMRQPTLKNLTAEEPVRVEVWETAERKQQFGHPHRQAAVERLIKMGCEWIGLTNQDNYYVPVYFEWMLSAAQAKKVPLVYCDMVHSHQQWKPMTTRPKRGQIDLGGFLAHKSLVERVRFDKFTFAGDGDYFERLLQAAKNRVEKVAATLFIHN